MIATLWYDPKSGMSLFEYPKASFGPSIALIQYYVMYCILSNHNMDQIDMGNINMIRTKKNNEARCPGRVNDEHTITASNQVPGT